MVRSQAARTCQEVSFDWGELAASLRRGLEPVLEDVAESVQVGCMGCSATKLPSAGLRCEQ